MSNEGILKTFTQEGLETMAKNVLHTFSEQPDLIIRDPGLAQQLFGGVLSSISEVSVLNVESLATATVARALETVSDHPELLKFDYGNMVADLARKIATLVKDKIITNIQGQDIIRETIASLVENPKLLIDLQKKLAAITIDAVIDIAGEDAGALISDGLISDTVAGVLYAVTVAGQAAIDNQSIDEFEERLKQLLHAGMVRAEAELGLRMGMQSLPDVLELLVIAWAQGKIEITDPQNEDFIKIFAALADHVQGAVQI
jgi:hypothetical protein